MHGTGHFFAFQYGESRMQPERRRVVGLLALRKWRGEPAKAVCRPSAGGWSGCWHFESGEGNRRKPYADRATEGGRAAGTSKVERGTGESRMQTERRRRSGCWHFEVERGLTCLHEKRDYCHNDNNLFCFFAYNRRTPAFSQVSIVSTSQMLACTSPM